MGLGLGGGGSGVEKRRGWVGELFAPYEAMDVPAERPCELCHTSTMKALVAIVSGATDTHSTLDPKPTRGWDPQRARCLVRKTTMPSNKELARAQQKSSLHTTQEGKRILSAAPLFIFFDFFDFIRPLRAVCVMSLWHVAE